MPSVDIQVDNKRFNEALAEVVREMKKDAPKETMRQGKLLALAIASAAPPRINGLKGLAAGIPKAKGISRMKVIKRLVKPAYSMRVIDAVRMNSVDILWGIANSRKNPVFTKDTINGSALQRILESAKTGTVTAMKNLKQLLGNAPNGHTAQVYQDYNQGASKHYKRLLDKMGKDGLKSVSQSERVYLLEPIKRERAKILAEYLPTVGTLKAGWVQAAIAIPINAGRRPPAWLLNKKTIGSSRVEGTGSKSSVSITNSKGNAIGFNTRIDYVGRAIRYRRMRMLNGVKGFMRRKLSLYYTKQGKPVPADLREAYRPRSDDYEVPI